MDAVRPRLLFLAHLLPYPLDGGAKIKSYHTLRALASAYDITLVAFIRTSDENQYLKDLKPYCTGGIQTVPIARSGVRNIADAAASLLLLRSFIVSRDHVPAMQKVVRERLDGQRFAAVHIDHLQMAQYVLPRRTGARLILDHHNIESMIIKRLAETTPSRAMRLYAAQEWPKLERYEAKVCKQCDAVLTVTEEDAIAVRLLAPETKSVTAVPIGVDGEYFCPLPRLRDSKTLLSIGTMSWQPNIDAIFWFTEAIYPLIKAQEPGVKLNVVGATPTAKVRSLALADPSISVPGYVDDVRETAEDCAAFIVPLLSGGGMRVKIVNALSMALPVVSTHIGAEGIAATHDKDILIANNPENFARACVRLIRDPALRDRLGNAGRELVETRYAWSAIGRLLLDVYRKTLAE